MLLDIAADGGQTRAVPCDNSIPKIGQKRKSRPRICMTSAKTAWKMGARCGTMQAKGIRTGCGAIRKGENMLKRIIICAMLALCLAVLSGCDALDEALDRLNSKSTSSTGSGSSGGEMDWSFVPAVREMAVKTFTQGFPEARATETSVATSGGDSSRVIVRISYEMNGKTGDYGFDYEKNEAGEYELKRYGDGVSVDDL